MAPRWANPGRNEMDVVMDAKEIADEVSAAGAPSAAGLSSELAEKTNITKRDGEVEYHTSRNGATGKRAKAASQHDRETNC